MSRTKLRLKGWAENERIMNWGWGSLVGANFQISVKKLMLYFLCCVWLANEASDLVVGRECVKGEGLGSSPNAPFLLIFPYFSFPLLMLCLFMGLVCWAHPQSPVFSLLTSCPSSIHPLLLLFIFFLFV